MMAKQRIPPSASFRSVVPQRLHGGWLILLLCCFLTTYVGGFTASTREACIGVVNGVGNAIIGRSRCNVKVCNPRRHNRLCMSEDDAYGGIQDSIGFVHHTALKTRNITLASQFYSLLGFEIVAKFKAGPARAAWLEQTQLETTTNTTTMSPRSRIELIEVPSWILNEPEGMNRRAVDLFQNQAYLGQNHFALDVTCSIRNSKVADGSSAQNHTLLLSAWMEILNEQSLQLFRKTLRVALEPEQFMVGNVVYERAFIYDADGALIELLHKATELPQEIDPMSGWERYEWFEGIAEMDSTNDTGEAGSNN